MNRDRQPKGQNIGISKLTDDKVKTILLLRKAGHSLKAIAKDFGISFGTVGHISQGRTWKHIAR